MDKIYRVKVRIARRSHRCCKCGNTINKGDEYAYVSSIVVNGNWKYYNTSKSNKFCIDCIKREMREVVENKFGFPLPVPGKERIITVKSIEDLIDLMKKHTVSFGIRKGFRIC